MTNERDPMVAKARAQFDLMSGKDALTSGRDAFRAIRWARDLPTLRTAKGHVDTKLHLMAFVLAVHADGSTGENAYPSLKTLAYEVHVADEDAAKEILERGAALGLWSEEDESAWGTRNWTLNLFDEKLIARLEDAEEERTLHKRELRAGRNARHYGKLKADRPETLAAEELVQLPTEPEGQGRSPLRLKTPTSASQDAVDTVSRHTGPRLKTQTSVSSDALSTPPTNPLNLPSLTSPADLPSLGSSLLDPRPRPAAREGAFGQKPNQKTGVRPRWTRGGDLAAALSAFDTEEN